MNSSTTRAIHRHAARIATRARILDERVEIIEDRPAYTVPAHAEPDLDVDGRPCTLTVPATIYPASSEVVVEVHRDDDGRWVVASWDARARQYRGHSPSGARAMGVSYRYTYGGTLGQLRRLGVPSYPSPAAALAAIREV